MEILINDKVIETKDIADIVDVETHKTMFLNREAGFKIIFLDNTELVFKQTIPYDSYPSEIALIKQYWQRKMDAAIEKWQSDKTEIERV